MATDLKKFLDATKSDTRLLGDVERHLLMKPRDDRSTTVLHPSEIIKDDFCFKYSYYLMTGGTPKTEKPSLRLQNIFDEGHYIHAKWQNSFYDMGVMYGKFKCLVCKGITFGLSPQTCDHCNGNVLEYDEVSLRDESLRMAGHTDGWIKDAKSDCLIEIKSIGEGTLRFEAPDLLLDADGDLNKAWRNIRRPFRGHMLQGQMYLELARRMYGDEAPKEIVFLYELKSNQDYKEFVVKADYEIVERIFKKAEKVINAVDNGVMPDCNVKTEGCKQCNLIP